MHHFENDSKQNKISLKTLAHPFELKLPINELNCTVSHIHWVKRLFYSKAKFGLARRTAASHQLSKYPFKNPCVIDSFYSPEGAVVRAF